MNNVKQRLLEAFGMSDAEVGGRELEEAVDLMLAKLQDLGYVIVPVSQMIATDLADFEMTIKQFVEPTVDKLEDAVQVHISFARIAEELKQKGWHIIPPAGTLTYADVETSIRQHLDITIGKTDNLVSVEDVPAEAIIQALRQKGWFLLPPRS